MLVNDTYQAIAKTTQYKQYIFQILRVDVENDRRHDGAGECISSHHVPMLALAQIHQSHVQATQLRTSAPTELINLLLYSKTPPTAHITCPPPLIWTSTLICIHTLAALAVYHLHEVGVIQYVRVVQELSLSRNRQLVDIARLTLTGLTILHIV